MELPRRNRRSGPTRPVPSLFEDELYQDDSYQDDSYPDELYQSPYEDQGYQRRQPQRTQLLSADQDYGYGYEDRPARRRRGPGRFIAALGAALLVFGGGVIVRAVAERGHVYGPAEQIPANVGTSVPGLDGRVAKPLAFSRPVQIEIPKLDVNAPVMRLGLAANHTVAVPPLENHNLAGWYDGSVTPGQKGTSVILGHVDSFTGISVFFYIKTLRRGNQIKVMRANGSTAIFTVDGVQKVVKTSFPTSDVYGQVKYPSLRLITCGGPFDTATRQYLDDIVVYAHLTRTIRGTVR